MNLHGRALEYVAGAYVLGTLSPRACRRFEALMKQNITARRAWQQWEERLSGLALNVPPVRPHDRTLPNILARVQKHAQRPKRFTQGRWALVAAIVLALAVALILMRA
jgi:anti-sigma-K factor RskA